MGNNEQKKEDRTREGLQKPIPAIFKGIAGAEKKAREDSAAYKSKAEEERRGDKSELAANKKVKASFFKNPVFVTIILLIFSITALLFILQSTLKFEREKKYRQILNAHLSELLTKQKQLQESAKELEDSLNEKAKELEEYKERSKPTSPLESTDEVLKNYKNKLMLLDQEKNKLTEDLEKTRGLAEELKSNLAQVQEKLAYVQADKIELEKMASELKREKEIWEIRLRRMGIDIGAVDIGKEGKGLEARVLIVERGNQLVAIDIGELEGVTPGMEFDIYKNDVLFGRIKIEQVHETISLGRIIAGVGIGNIEEGLTAKRR